MSVPSDGLQARFREVMAHVPSPVSIVTALNGGLPHGTTVSAFASLSIEPPMVLVALDRGSELLASIRRTHRFGINVLGVAQSALALAFARKGGVRKFQGVKWDVHQDLPRLAGAPGWLACTVADLVGGGDHVIALGLVEVADTVEAEPLIYHRRVFGTHAAIEVDR